MEKNLCSVYPRLSISGAGCDPILQNYVDRTGNDCKRKVRKRNKGVQLSTDPQSVAARHRRHRISDRFKILQSLVPGGTKMDTVSMLDEAIQYVKFLKTQIWIHQVNMAMENQSSSSVSGSSSSSSSLLTQPPPPPSLPFNSDFTSEQPAFFNDSSLF